MANSIPELTKDIVYNISFDVFESCDFFTSYAYEAPNDKIELARLMLADNNLKNMVESEIDRDWQDAQLLIASDSIPEDMKHILRIAMLVNRFSDGHTVNPVSIDTFSNAPSFLEGHHRLLALKYMGHNSFPAYLSGYIDVLEENLHISMFTPKTLMQKAYENVDTLVNHYGYDHSRAIDETIENYDLTEEQEHELFRTWLENNNNGTV